MSEEYDINKKMLGFVFTAAMQDAVRQSAYNGERKWLWEPEVFEKLYPLLTEHLESILKNGYKDQDDYDNKFIILSIKICEIINDVESCNDFSFGNAQKLINMIDKYFYLRTYGTDKTDEKKRFRFCHCPVDGNMLEKVWKSKAKTLKEMNNAKFIIINGENKFKNKEFLAGWGNMDEKEYEEVSGKYRFRENGRYHVFQKLVREIIRDDDIKDTNGSPIIPLEYDYIFWGQNQ